MTEPASAPPAEPLTRARALALADRFAALSADRAGHDAHYAAESSKLQAAADAVLGPIDAELANIRVELEPWYAANEAELTGGKRKSIEFGGCTLAFRLGNATVRHGEIDDDAAVVKLRAQGQQGFVKTKLSLDRPAIAKFLRSEADALAVATAAKTRKADMPTTPLTKLGFFLDRARTFVLEPTPSDRPATGAAA